MVGTETKAVPADKRTRTAPAADPMTPNVVVERPSLLGKAVRWGLAMTTKQNHVEQPSMSPELHRAVAEIIKEKYIPKWLTTENEMLDGRKPCELLANNREDVIWDALKRVHLGDPS